VANQYINIENSRVFWVDALEELKQSFASDAAWIVDYEPLAFYNPNDPKSGKSIVKADFTRIAVGNSSLDNVQKGRQPNQGGQGGDNKAPAANAVKITGFWRDNPRNANVVFDLLNKLKENAGNNSHYRFGVWQDGKMVPLDDKQLVPRLDTAPAPEQFAAQFEIILPLKKEVSFK
ncbi:MAG: hypothetical protein AAGB14_16200, partial [Verrucomicrobiota bacterium]